MREITFTRAQEEILAGTLLGDSYLPNTEGNRQSQFHCEHSTKQQAYALWKAEQLGCKVFYRDRYDERTDKVYHSVSMYSEASPTYSELRKKLYPEGGHKSLSIDLLNQMGPLGLAILYFDDGFTDYDCRRCRLCTEKYSLAEQQVLQQWFIRKWGLNPIITERPSNGNMKYALLFDVVDSYKLLEIIKPFVPTEDVRYKTVVKPYTENRMPRWYKELTRGLN